MKPLFKSISKDKEYIADDLADAGEGEESFWYSTHVKMESADKKAVRLNRLLAGSGASANVERDENYGGRGWGIHISGFSSDAERKLRGG